MNAGQHPLFSEVTDEAAALAARVETAEAALSKGIALAGAGFHGTGIARALKEEGARVACFLDNDPAKQRLAYEGLPVVPVSDFSTSGAHFAFITARHAVRAVEAQLTEAKIPCLSYDAFFVCRHFERLRAVRGLLADARSREVFDRLLIALLRGDASPVREVHEAAQYFALPEFIPARDTHFVDAGAYNGDTLVQFLRAGNGAFAQVYAFEPSADSFRAMQARVTQVAQEWGFDPSRITSVQGALGERGGLARSHHAGQAQNHSIEPGADGDVKVYALDSYLGGKKVNFIKADVEGLELALLKGARKTIESYTPKLAISLYHRLEDLFEIPEWIAGLGLGYRFALRHHSPTLMETVLYASAD